MRRLTLVVLGAMALGACGSGSSSTGGAGTGGGAGTNGAAGTSAAAGTNGAAGTSAAAGTNGAAGTSAAAGTNGAAGTTAAAGTNGAAGTSAAAGTNGAAGTGAAGTAGGAAGTAGGAGTSGAAGTGPFALTSTAFTAGMEIPLMYKCANVNPMGMNQSPPLSWTPGPAGTKSYAVTLNHMAADNSAHWAIWDIPATTTSLAANVEHVPMPTIPAGSKQTHTNLDGFNGDGYLGPCPQAMNSRQSYIFTVWAIGVPTLGGVTTGSSTAQAQAAIKAAAIAGGSATLVGTQIRM